MWPCGALGSLLPLIYFQKLHLATVKTRTVTVVTSGNPGQTFVTTAPRLAFLSTGVHVCVSGSRRSAPAPGGSQVRLFRPCLDSPAPFLLAGRYLFLLALSCLWLGCDQGCEEARLSSGLPLAPGAGAGCRPKPSQAGARQLQSLL